MKKILFAALALALPYIDYGQIIQNGDFSVNSGNNGTNPCGTFASGSVPNWEVTHGTPFFWGHCANSPNSIYISNDYTVGEGIAGGYHFYKNKKYYVWLILCNWSADFNHSVINLKATQNLPSNLSATACQTSIPTNAGLNETIGTISNSSSPAVGNIVPIVFTPQYNNYNYVWLYPQALGALYGLDIEVSALYVARGCTDDLYFSVNNPATGYITPDPDEGFYYRAYSNIHAGSSLGSGSVPVNVNGATVTTFEAKRMVELLPNFTVTPSGTGYFEAHIDGLTCGTAGGYTDLPVPTQSVQNVMSDALARNIPEPETEDNTVVSTALFSIYPNPTTSKVTIETTSSVGPSTIQVIVSNILGQVLYKTQSEQNKMDVDLSSYAFGTYVITVQSANGTKTFKVDKK